MKTSKAPYVLMPEALRAYFKEEIRQHKAYLQQGRYKQAFHHLERAHIIGQPYPREHTLAHWHMLKFGFTLKDAKEIRGQLLRLLVGGVKSFVGTIPEGNTGGANVPPLKKMPVPADLQQIIQTNS